MTTFRDALRDDVAHDELPPGLQRMAADAGVIDAIVETDRMIASLTAAKYRLVAFAHETQTRGSGAPSHPLAEREFRAEIAAALRLSRRAAGMLIDDADVLTEHLPATLESLTDGRITPRHARILVDELATVPDDERDDIEARALEAAEQSANVFARTVRRIRESRSPEQAIERHRRAVDDRCVTLEPGADGMAWLIARLPAPEAVAADSLLDARARALRTGGDPRTLSQLRADLLAEALLGGDHSRPFGNSTPTVVTTVPISVLQGHDDAMGELVGYGPVDPATARRIAGAANMLRRAITDERDDAILALGRTRYRVTDDLRLFLAIRDGRCRFIGCTGRVTSADIDHGIAWADGGHTDATSLEHLCRGDHTLKGDTRWRIEAIHPDGTIDWLSPVGRRYRTRPERVAARGIAARAGADPP
jgi:hypothetical protein